MVYYRSHKPILLKTYYSDLGCVAPALSCVAPHYVASCVSTQELDIQTRRMKIFVTDTPAILNFYLVHISVDENWLSWLSHASPLVTLRAAWSCCIRRSKLVAPVSPSLIRLAGFSIVLSMVRALLVRSPVLIMLLMSFSDCRRKSKYLTWVWRWGKNKSKPESEKIQAKPTLFPLSYYTSMFTW